MFNSYNTALLLLLLLLENGKGRSSRDAQILPNQADFYAVSPCGSIEIK